MSIRRRIMRSRSASNTKKLPATNHQEADEYWFVRKGTAKVDAADRSQPPSAPQDVGAGDVVYVPRNVPYAIDPVQQPLRVCGSAGIHAAQPATRRLARDAPVARRCPNRRHISQPRRRSTRRSPTNLDRRSCGFPGGANVNMIIYNGAIGPYESHEDVDQIYFVRHGTAKAAYGRPLDQPDGDRRQVRSAAPATSTPASTPSLLAISCGFRAINCTSSTRAPEGSATSWWGCPHPSQVFRSRLMAGEEEDSR